jgi:uncharacterized 2Fe-2S/4Fe-4S cluster protein (DUF4445 family)
MRARIEDLVTRITKVETAIEPRFQEHFVAANAIPHATAPFPIPFTRSISSSDMPLKTLLAERVQDHRARRCRGATS